MENSGCWRPFQNAHTLIHKSINGNLSLFRPQNYYQTWWKIFLDISPSLGLTSNSTLHPISPKFPWTSLRFGVLILQSIAKSDLSSNSLVSFMLPLLNFHHITNLGTFLRLKLTLSSRNVQNLTVMVQNSPDLGLFWRIKAFSPLRKFLNLIFPFPWSSLGNYSLSFGKFLNLIFPTFP